MTTIDEKGVQREDDMLTVAILLFPEVEVLDFAGPFEVFSVASRLAVKSGAVNAPFHVVTLAASGKPVVARHGLQILADHSFEDVPPVDVLLIPGGVVTQPLEDAATLAWITAASSQAQIVASVCTGAFLLARLGILDGHRATTHWEDIAHLRAMVRDTTVLEDVPFVDEGRLITSAGISAGIAMSLHIVGRLAGTDLAVRTARQMQYDWTP